MDQEFGGDLKRFLSSWGHSSRVRVDWCPIIKKADWEQDQKTLEEARSIAAGIQFPDTSSIEEACRQLGILAAELLLVDKVTAGLALDYPEWPTRYWVAWASTQLGVEEWVN